MFCVFILKNRAQVYYEEDPQFYNNNLIELIVKANDKNKYPGSSTMAVAALNNHTLKTCYIGGIKPTIKTAD